MGLIKKLYLLPRDATGEQIFVLIKNLKILPRIRMKTTYDKCKDCGEKYGVCPMALEVSVVEILQKSGDKFSEEIIRRINECRRALTEQDS